MLKLTYTEDGLSLEQVGVPLEMLIAQRVMLAVRVGQTLYLEPGQASFLLPADAVGLEQLEHCLRSQPSPTLSLQRVDEDYVEVSVRGNWLAEKEQAHTGIFLTHFSDRIEFFLFKLWQETQVAVQCGGF